jgi:hypothetical protein
VSYAQSNHVSRAPFGAIRCSFRLSLDRFLAKRGGSAMVTRGRALKQSNAALFG